MTDDISIDELIGEGRLSEAIDRLASATSDEDRLLLQQWRAITGQPFESWSAEWDRVIKTDRERRAGRIPDNVANFLPGTMVHALWQANLAMGRGDSDAAIDAFDTAESLASELRGTIDGEPFVGLRDCHDPTAFVIEWIEGERYRWISLADIRTLTIDDAGDPIELILNPATVTLMDGTVHNGHLPLVYAVSATSHGQHEESIEIGQATDFNDHCGLTVARGRRMWQIEDQEVDVTSIRQIEFETPGRVKLM